jgi:hypothetical protein
VGIRVRLAGVELAGTAVADVPDVVAVGIQLVRVDRDRAVVDRVCDRVRVRVGLARCAALAEVTRK